MFFPFIPQKKMQALCVGFPGFRVIAPISSAKDGALFLCGKTMQFS